MRYVTILSLFLFLAGESAVRAEDTNYHRLQLRRELPWVQFFVQGSRITRVYGPAFGVGDSPEQVAREFVARHAAAFGADADDLEPISRLKDGRPTQPVMFDVNTGTYKFTLVYYSQYKGGIPVFRSDIRLLVRNDPGYPLVLVSNSLRELGDFTVGDTIPPVRYDRVENAALDEFPGMINLSDPELIIWAGVEDMIVEPRLAVRLSAANGSETEPGYEKWLFVADCQSGEILYKENQILNIDIVGNIQAKASPGVKSDDCSVEVIRTDLPSMKVWVVGGAVTYTDASGNFVIPHPGTTPVTVRSEVRGLWFDVDNAAEADNQVEKTNVTPPGNITLTHNESPAQFYTAEVNAYIHANIVRDFILAGNPDYPGIKGEEDFPVIVNITSFACSASYSGTSILFNKRAGACSNMAFSDVVYHEYGHHVVDEGLSGQGAYGEGMGDTMGVIIIDRAEIAVGWKRNDCKDARRTADNNCQYDPANCSSCGSLVHECGKVLSGCVWETRNELVLTTEGNYQELLRDLAVNSILMHGFTSSIDPSITIDWLTLNDDNADILDGTPHYDQIAAGFGAHSMDAPQIDRVKFKFPNGLPDRIDPAGGTAVRVEIKQLRDPPLAGSGKFFYATLDAELFFEGTMNEVSPNVYDAVFPALACGKIVQFYFSAETTGLVEVLSPRAAPATVYDTVTAYDLTPVFDDDFELDRGWTVDHQASNGKWERGVPVGLGDLGDPPIDFDQIGAGNCFVTRNVDGDSDVDNGTTYLLSPVFDLSDGDAVITYARWYSNAQGSNPMEDTFTVWVSNNGGSSWTAVETVGPTGPEVDGLWFQRRFVVSDFVTPTSTVKVRFEASDPGAPLGNPSIVEAGVDDFHVALIDCTP